MTEYFDRYKWNPQLFRTPEEVNAALEQFEVKDKKIKAIHTIGLAHNMQPWAYQQTMRTTLAGIGIPYEDIDSGRYSNIDKTLLPCEVVLCEPVVFVFEDDSTLEIKPDGKGGLLLASNQIPPFIKDGLNHSNVDSEYLFSRAIGCSIREIWTTKTHAQTEYTCSGHGDQDDTSKWKFWMTGEYDLYFRHRWGGWYQFGITSDRIGCHDGKISYAVIKEAANRYMQIPIVERHDGSSYFWIMPVRHVAVSALFKTDFDNPMLEDIKKRFHPFTFDPDETRYQKKLTDSEKEQLIRDNIGIATDFYDRFVRRMRQMMEYADDYELISFMGP